MQRIRQLDGARGLAILAVFAYHAIHMKFLWMGVDLFFILSGFLITGVLLDRKQETLGAFLGGFYARRARRILAPYAIFLIVASCIIGTAWTRQWYFYLFLTNLLQPLHIPLPGAFVTLWSLAVEEHFYIFWPLLVRRCSTRTLVILASAVCIGGPFLRILLLPGHANPGHLASFFTWFNLDGLCLGGLLAIWVRMPSFRRNHLARIAPAVLLLSSISFFLLGGRAWAEATVIKSACNLACAAFLSCMLLLSTSQWKFLVDRPILKFFGFISYGLYLVHLWAFRIADILFSHQSANLVARGQPFNAILLRLGAGLALGIAIAYLSRRSLEERFLRIGHASGPRPRNSISDMEPMGMPAHRIS